MFSEKKSERLKDKYKFWINAHIILYYTSNSEQEISSPKNNKGVTQGILLFLFFSSGIFILSFNSRFFSQSRSSLGREEDVDPVAIFTASPCVNRCSCIIRA